MESINQSSMKIDLKYEIYWEQPSDDDASLLANGFFNTDPLDENSQEQKYSSNIVLLQPTTSSCGEKSSLFLKSELSTGRKDDEVEVNPKKQKNSLDNQIDNPTPKVVGKGRKRKVTLYKCNHCSYAAQNSTSRLKKHLKLHEEGSGAGICEACGQYLFPSKIRHHHLLYCRHRGQGQRKNDKNEKDLVTGATNTNDSQLPSSLFLDESDCDDLYEDERGSEEETTTTQKKKKENFMIKVKTGYYYHCTKCPFKTKSKDGFGIHLKLHEEGSDGVACDYCDWYVAESTIRYHLSRCQGRRHFQTQFQKLVKTTTTKCFKGSPGADDDADKKPAKRAKKKVAQDKGNNYICPKCPYKVKNRSAFEVHLKLHEEGSNAIPCEFCGRYLLPERRRQHLRLYCPDPRGREEIVRTVRTVSSKRKPTTSTKYLLCPSFKRRNKSYKCQKCSYQVGDLKRIQYHVKLHRKGSPAVPCLGCGIYVLPREVEAHNRVCQWRAKKSEHQGRVSAEAVVPIILGAGIL